MLNKFKDIWNLEYLLSLRETCRDIYETDFSNKIKVDQVILVKNPLKPRPFWQLGRVIELYPGSDNNTRSVKIKLGNNKFIL